MAIVGGSIIRQSSAAVCILAALLLGGGCGGSSKPATKPVDTSSVKGLCPTVLEVHRRYTNAANAMSLRFEDKRLVAATLKAIEELRLRVGQLSRVASERQRSQLAPLSTALLNQLLTIKAIVQHDTKTAAKYGNSINAPLRRGTANLLAICSHAG
jgi:hypothetical protein